MKDLNIQIAIKIYEYEELNAADRELLDAARQATYRSYAPYSHFSVVAESLKKKNCEKSPQTLKMWLPLDLKPADNPTVPYASNVPVVSNP